MISNSGTTSLGLYDFKRQIDAFGGVDYFRPTLTGGYLPNARVMLNNGEIVQNGTNGNLTNDPNTDMTGWYNFESSMVAKTNFYVTPEMYGLKNGYWTEALQWCETMARTQGREIVLSGVQYDTDAPIYFSGVSYKIRGNGHAETIINKVNDSKLGLSNVTRQGLSGPVSFEIDKDAVFICYNEGFQSLNFSYFTIQKYYQENRDLDTGFALFAPFVSEFTNIDFYTNFAYYGVYTIDCWMSAWIRCKANARAGYVLGGLDSDSAFNRGGTSLSLISCWSTDTGENESAYKLTGFHYSNAMSCGADNIGSDGKPAFSVWDVKECPTFVLNGCAQESVHAKHLFYVAENCRLSVTGHSTFNFYNKYKDAAAPFLIYATGASVIDIKNSNIPFIYDIGVDYPNLAFADFSSVINLNETRTYPDFTGINSGNFGLYSANGSHVDYKKDGIHLSNVASLTSATSGNQGLVEPAGKFNTSLFQVNEVRLWWNPVLEKLMANNYTNPSSADDGYVIGGGLKGTTTQRPPTKTIGMLYLDTSLSTNGKPIWSSGANQWVDYQGNLV